MSRTGYAYANMRSKSGLDEAPEMTKHRNTHHG